MLTKIESELAKLITTGLDLKIAFESIDPNEPMFGEGLGLDSIDRLEISLLLASKYNVKIKPDDKNNFKIFQSLRSLGQYMELNAKNHFFLTKI